MLNKLLKYLSDALDVRHYNKLKRKNHEYMIRYIFTDRMIIEPIHNLFYE